MSKEGSSHEVFKEKKRKRRHEEKDNEKVDPQSLKKRLAPIRNNLPVHQFRQEIIELIKSNEAVLVVAETGSGKSTQIPAYLHEEGLLSRKNSNNFNAAPNICVVQPRRVAAITVAKRVANELGCHPGKVVGHRVRFDDFTDRKRTKIVYLTDGMLLREATADPLLSAYGIVVLDEAHERALQTDVLFGVVKRAMKARNDQLSREEVSNESPDLLIQQRMAERANELRLPKLRVVVMSATLDVSTFQTFFPEAKTIRIPGRLYPVQTLYTKEPQQDYLDAALMIALQIHEEGDDGDILIFLPGQEEIENLSLLLKKHLEMADIDGTKNDPKDLVQSIRGIGKNLHASGSSMVQDVLICVLYAALPPSAQMLAFQPKPDGCKRKIILSTNIAETSVTLDGIKYVVDCGKHKTRDFHSATGMESLSVHDISKAQAAQRAGRAGRVSSGFCFRLYTENAFDTLDDNITPEILRVNLAQVVLQLKGMGVHDPRKFDFLTPPSPKTLMKAFELLYALEAVDDNMDLTEYGRKLAKLPLDPTFGHLLLQSSEHNCTSEILSTVAMLSTENVFYRQHETSGKAAMAHRRFTSYEGDIPTLVNVYQAWQNEAIYMGNKPKGKGEKISHNEWCTRNFINGRALVQAFKIRNQLKEICERSAEKNGLGLKVEKESGVDQEAFFRAVCAGLFLQVASRIQATVELDASKGNSGRTKSERGRYKTKISGREVSIHPTSSMFGRNPAPKTVVYTELLTTTKTYIRGVTQIREEWLTELAPNFFKAPTSLD